jgi:hypothetical protein
LLSNGYVFVDTLYQSRQTACELSLILVAVWSFGFEVTKVLEPKKHFEISVVADNWSDASGNAAYEFMKQNPEYQGADFTSVTSRLISVEVDSPLSAPLP